MTMASRFLPVRMRLLGGRVPLARRNLFQDRRRALLATGGVAVALLLVLILDGILTGAMRQGTAYIDRLPADLVVSQQGVRTMHMSASALRPDIGDQARAVPGVVWAEPIRFTSAIVGGPRTRLLTYVIGYDPVPGNRGGPRRLVGGRAPASGEALLDSVAAEQLGVTLGGRVLVFGEPFTVSGLFAGGTSIVNTTVFITSDEFARLRGPAQSYLLVGASPGTGLGELRARLEGIPPGNTVQTRAEFSHQEARITSDMTTDLMRIMTGIGLAIALAVIALTLFTVTLAKLREYGVVKALGGRPAQLAGIVAAQAVWQVVLALALATVLAVLVGVTLGAAAPTIQLTVTPASVLRTGVGGLMVGAAGAVIPLRRVLRVDPASAFRRPS